MRSHENAVQRSWLSISWLAIGIVFGTKISLFGEIYGGEIFSLIALPVLILTRKIKNADLVVLCLGAAWGCAQLISDLYNQTEMGSSVKGVLAPVVLCVTTVSISSIFSKRIHRMPSVLLGVVLAYLAQVVFLPSEYQEFQPWKWGYGPVVLMAGMVWFSFFGSSLKLVAIFIFSFMVVCIALGARSLAILPVIGLLAYVFWKAPSLLRIKRWLQGRGSIPKVAALVFVSIVALNASLSVIFSSDLLGEHLDAEVSEKYQRQATSDVGMLLAGRSESLVSIRAFLDAPLLGHGSWAEDKSGYLSQYAALQFKFGISDDIQESSRPFIPAHSYILGAMVWSGIAGGIFWVTFVCLLLHRYIGLASRLPLYFHAGMVTFLWNVLFSPFGAEARWAVALFAAALFSYCSYLRSEK